MDRHSAVNAAHEVRSAPRDGRKLFRSAVIIASVSFLTVIANIDVATGPDFSFSFCYMLPVLLATWFVGRWSGFVMAVTAAFMWHFAEKHGAFKYRNPAMAYWNMTCRFLFLLLGSAVLSAFKNVYTRLELMVAMRTKILRRVTVQLLEAEDFERRRLAYDIHDSLGQTLTLLKLNLSSPLPSDGSLPCHQKDDAVSMVDELIERSRTLMFDLHPAMLDQFGLVPTLRRYAEQYIRRTAVEVLVVDDGHCSELPGRISSCLFRSIKELLNNAVKHGQARQIVVRINWGTETIRIVVDDDGHGFETAEVSAPRIQKGLGLAGIRERIFSLGGSLRLESNPGQGTRVVLELPSQDQETLACA